MWPFGRKAQPVASKGPDAVPVPMIRTDWKGLPPVQRAIGKHPLTARGDLFADDLATHQDPSVVSRTLGHNVSLDAPAGMVLAVTRPSTREDGPSMVSRPRIQRKASGSSSAGGELSGLDQEPDASPVPQSSGFRELPVVAAPAAIQRLTTIAPELTPVPIGPGREIQSRPLEVQRSTASFDDDAPPAGTSPAVIDDSQAALPARRTLGQSRRLGLGAPLAQVPATVQRATELTLASPRREPAAESTITTRAEISPETTSSTTAAGSDLTASAPTVDSANSPASAAGPQAPLSVARIAGENPAGLAPESLPEFASDRLDLPLAPTSPGNPAAPAIPAVSMSAAGESQAASPTDSSTTAMGLPASLQRAISPEGAGLEDLSPRSLERPLILRHASVGNPTPPAADLLGSTPGLRSSSLTATEPSSSHGFSSADSGRALAVSRLAGQGSLNTPGSSLGLAPLAGSRGLGTVQRSAIAGGAPARAHILGSGPAATGAALAINGSDRETGLTSDGIWHDASQHEPEQTTSPAQSRFSLQRISDAQSGPAESPLSLPLAPVATMASLQRATASIEAAALLSPIALQPSATEQAFPDRQETFFAQRDVTSGSSAGGPSTQGPAAAAEPAAQDEAMDALAGKLYDRIRSRLKSELLVDRERAGLLTDLR